MNKLLKTKKGQSFQQLMGIVVALAGIAITIVITFLIMAQTLTQTGVVEGIDTTNATQCAGSYACNATNTLREAVGVVPAWIGIIVLVAIAGVLIGLVMAFRKFRS